ncbi:PIF1-like helicase domain-containing protein [Hirsutella rhossiliensis]|uniref:ATP-dependent DNA helicase n=1 Tax=Hirsutella rhossiliensis TaxID=111463 RepID=A0A9P8MY40_9HYPO|nr:PIF1-like helicase domain-containing protein [Hirsutella rhossiliensis]KAH0961272.1 PIF1-like helicase domain-containing protein [Hirsutella rhossiliensis]
MDAEDYFNLLLSPVRPRRYREQLGADCDSDAENEDENNDNDSVYESPEGGRDNREGESRDNLDGKIDCRGRHGVFEVQATLREFWTKLDNDQMEYCSRCHECWFQMEIDYDGICSRCYRKDEKRGPDEPYFFSAENQLDFGPVPTRLPELTPTEEALIARVHVHVNIMLVRGQQYKYRGHVVNFLREVGLVYNQLPLLPRELNTVLLRPANTSSHANLSRQFARHFRVRRQAVMIWLDYLRHHHPGYRSIAIDDERLSQLPEDGSVVDAIPQSQVEAADHVRSYRVDEDSYNLKRWRRLAVECFAAAYQCCRQRHHFHEDDHYGEVGANELQAEDDEFEREEHEEPVVEEDWHELARMLPDHPLEEDDIDVLGRRDVDVNYDWTPHVGRYTDDGILHGDFWKQRKAESPLHLDVDHQPLEARDSLNPEQRLVYDTVMGHFLTQACSQLLLHVDGGGGTGKSYLINLLSAHLQAASGGRGTPVWRAAPTGVAGNQISGTTLHSLLHLPINKDFKPLSAIDKAQLQKKLKNVKYLIVDEKSMLGLRQLSWIDDRLREAFPNRNEEFFGGLNILLVGDFFQLPQIKGRNAYRRFDKTVFLKVAQRQRGDDQGAFRSALEELRLLQLSMESWKLLSSRVQAKLDDQEVARFVNSLRVYATKDRVMAKNVGPDAAAAPDDKPVGLCNGARDPPCVIMMEFDKYMGPVFLTTSDGRKIVPILPVNRDFLVGSTLCTRTQFPLIVCYAITVHKSQSITEDMIVTDLSCRDFQTGLSYVAVSRVKTLQGLMLDAPFDRNHLTYARRRKELR